MLHHVVKSENVNLLSLLCLLVIVLVNVLLQIVTQDRLRVGFLVDRLRGIGIEEVAENDGL